MLQGDLKVKTDATASKSRGKKRGRSRKFHDDEEAAFHFNAFVPIQGELWKLDGLKTQPILLGKQNEALIPQLDADIAVLTGKVADNDWLSMARPAVTKRMEEDEKCTQNFALLALCRDPMVVSVPELASNIKTINKLLDKYDEDIQDPKQSSRTLFKDSLDQGVLLDSSDYFGVDKKMITGASVLSEADTELQMTDKEILERLLRSTIAQQEELRSRIRESLDEHDKSQKEADDRRQDYSPFVREWLEMLARKDGLMDLVDLDLIPKRFR
jgi:ubiquitin carboxyl-terminal hydrolase L5